MWVVEPAEIQTDLISAKALVKSTKQKKCHEKVISKNPDMGQCAPVEAVINNEQPSKHAEMLTKYGETGSRFSSFAEK